MIPFLIIIAVIPWTILIWEVTWLYFRFKPQIKMMWLAIKAVWITACMAANQKTNGMGPGVQRGTKSTWSMADVQTKIEQAKKDTGINLIDSDHVVKIKGNA